MSDAPLQTRVAAFVDGFNVYHALLSRPHLAKYKWLNYWKLSERFLPRNSQLVSVQYFTALATWDHGKVCRHQLYMRALKNAGVGVVAGRFAERKKRVIIFNSASKRQYSTIDGMKPGTFFFGYHHEEKKTDVAIGCAIVAMAATDEYDVALLISGDTDFEPAIRTVQRSFGKDVIVAVPNRQKTGSLKKLVKKGHCVLIREKDLASSQLDDTIVLPSGKSIVKPSHWH